MNLIICGLTVLWVTVCIIIYKLRDLDSIIKRFNERIYSNYASVNKLSLEYNDEKGFVRKQLQKQPPFRAAVNMLSQKIDNINEWIDEKAKKDIIKDVSYEPLSVEERLGKLEDENKTYINCFNGSESSHLLYRIRTLEDNVKEHNNNNIDNLEDVLTKIETLVGQVNDLKNKKMNKLSGGAMKVNREYIDKIMDRLGWYTLPFNYESFRKEFDDVVWKIDRLDKWVQDTTKELKESKEDK